jgi:DNA-binding CsgD family transcriptional regulator
LEVCGIRNADARALLDSALRFKLDERVRDRIAETRGNPLALLELPRGLTATQLAGGFGLIEQRGLVGRIEESFVRRIAQLSEDTRLLLLVAGPEPTGDPLLLSVRGVLYNGLGRYDKALREAHEASEEEAPELWTSSCALVEAVEAAARMGETRVAGDGLARLAEATSVGHSDWGLGIYARSRAWLSEGEDAERSYREAIERLSRTQLRPEFARGAPALRRVVATRDPSCRRPRAISYRSRALHDDRDGGVRRARADRAAGNRRARARAQLRKPDNLTAQEQQIADMARDGFSNPDIGSRLFLSPRTVEWHLRHVFAKLGIKSRRDLARVLARSEAEAAVT